MAKKKPKSSKKSPQKGRSHDPGADALFDPTFLESTLRHLLPSSGRGKRTSPLDRAQDLVYQAIDSQGTRRVELARQALALSADCADAWTILAQETRVLSETLDLYQKAVDAGRRALGDKAFQKLRGNFWGVMETRPFMRAKLGLAQSLWDAGRREEAVGHFQEMLELAPGDNQGVRYLLVGSLLDLGREQDLQQLLNQYRDDPSTDWAYTKALLAFRREGDTPVARRLLHAAETANRHVPDLLSGSRMMPDDLPEYISPGEEDDAVAYVANSRGAWRATPGALAWMRKTLKLALPSAAEPTRPPWRTLQTALVRLPQVEGEVWQVDVRQFSSPIEIADLPMQPWVVAIVRGDGGEPVSFEIGASRPEPADVFGLLTATMYRPDEGEPHRPVRIEVVRKTFHRLWLSKLRQIGVECELCETLDQVDRAMVERIPPLEFIRSAAHQDDSEGAEEADLTQLPQDPDDVWQADVRQLPTWVENEGDPHRPWATIVVGSEQAVILAQDLSMEKPEVERLWSLVASGVSRPMVGEPHRPGVIQVRSDAYRELLEPRLAPLGIGCTVEPRLDQLDTIFRELGDHLAGGSLPPALLDIPGMQPEQVRGFFVAAAEFYRRAPWREVPADRGIRVQCSQFESGPWFAVVMGQSGMTLGLALYEDLEVLLDILSSRGPSEANSRRTSGLSVIYGEAFEMPVRDLEAVEENGWPIAGPEAHPHAIRINPGRVLRPPLAWELELLEACLLAIPDFLRAEQPRRTVRVPVASGELELQLSWLDATEG